LIHQLNRHGVAMDRALAPLPHRRTTPGWPSERLVNVNQRL